MQTNRRRNNGTLPGGYSENQKHHSTQRDNKKYNKNNLMTPNDSQPQRETPQRPRSGTPPGGYSENQQRHSTQRGKKKYNKNHLMTPKDSLPQRENPGSQRSGTPPGGYSGSQRDNPLERQTDNINQNIPKTHRSKIYNNKSRDEEDLSKIHRPRNNEIRDKQSEYVSSTHRSRNSQSLDHRSLPTFPSSVPYYPHGDQTTNEKKRPGQGFPLSSANRGDIVDGPKLNHLRNNDTRHKEPLPNADPPKNNKKSANDTFPTLPHPRDNGISTHSGPTSSKRDHPSKQTQPSPHPAHSPSDTSSITDEKPCMHVFTPPDPSQLPPPPPHFLQPRPKPSAIPKHMRGFMKARFQ